MKIRSIIYVYDDVLFEGKKYIVRIEQFNGKKWLFEAVFDYKIAPIRPLMEIMPTNGNFITEEDVNREIANFLREKS